MLPCEVRPQRRNAESAELMAEMAVMVVAEREKRLLSLKKPKKDDETMPGRLKIVKRRVAEVWERERDVMGVGVEVGLWDTVARALKDDGYGVDVESTVFEEMPRDFPRSEIGA